MMSKMEMFNVCYCRCLFISFCLPGNALIVSWERGKFDVKDGNV